MKVEVNVDEKLVVKNSSQDYSVDQEPWYIDRWTSIITSSFCYLSCQIFFNFLADGEVSASLLQPRLMDLSLLLLHP